MNLSKPIAVTIRSGVAKLGSMLLLLCVVCACLLLTVFKKDAQYFLSELRLGAVTTRYQHAIETVSFEEDQRLMTVKSYDPEIVSFAPQCILAHHIWIYGSNLTPDVLLSEAAAAMSSLGWKVRSRDTWRISYDAPDGKMGATIEALTEEEFRKLVGSPSLSEAQRTQWKQWKQQYKTIYVQAFLYTDGCTY